MMNEDHGVESKQEETIKSESSSKRQDLSAQKISLEIKAKNPIYEIEISTKCSAIEIPHLIDGIIKEIEKSKKFSPAIIESKPPMPRPVEKELTDDPLALLATELGVDYNDLKESKLLSIRNQTVQILKSTALAPSESCYLLLAAHEYGLKKPPMPYDDWKELCDASKIKSKTPFYKLVDNAKRNGHINKKTYDKSKEVTLEPKGLETVQKAVSKYLSKQS